MTPRRCIVCDASAWTMLSCELQRCDQCGFVTARELPDQAAVARLYGASYFQGGEYADYAGDREAHLANSRRRLERIAAVAGPIESLYEIGCAHGYGLAAAAEHGIRAAGVDISDEAVRHARESLGVDATRGAFEDLPIERGRYQAFCLWDTIEHLAHPETAVERIAALLEPGGWLFVTTGDIGSATARRDGARWRMIHPPTHLQYFSRETITRFLARHALTVVHIESAAVCRSLFGTLAGLDRFGHGATKAAARAALGVLPAALTRRVRFTVDLGDIMLVCARR